MLAHLVSAFIVGLFGSLHCVGMCGGIIGALSFSVPPQVRADRLRLLAYLSAYSTGRIGSYVVAGGLIGAVGASLLAALGNSGHALLQAAATLVMCGIGLHIAGLFPQLAQIERLGAPLWRRLQPLARHLLPVRSVWQALAYGAAWGWLPCGMVYSMLLWSLGQHDIVGGMASMAAFGVGTLPAVLGVGVVTLWLGQLARRQAVRRLAGLSLTAMALAMFLFTKQPFIVQE